MKISKQAISTSLAVAGLVVSGSVFAMPGFSEQVPESSIEICVAQIGEQANYEGASRVLHKVDWKARRFSGHTIMIDTTVFGADGDVVLREYATLCAVSDKSETKKFRLKEKSV